jgi:1,4-alpha-glucan branching enzyme
VTQPGPAPAPCPAPRLHGYLSLVLHAHMPFVRHPEHETFLEENWLYEVITESYLPLWQLLERWGNDRIHAPLTLTLTPTLCAMLRDPLLKQRYARYLDQLIDLAEKETHRTLWERPLQELALFYHDRLRTLRTTYQRCQGDLIGAFRQAQDAGLLEIITSAATHAVLPLLARHPPSLRAQVRIGCDQYRACFGRDPRGIWLPECAYDPQIEPALAEANLRWFITDTHGLLHARPKPRFGIFAPILTDQGLAAFGRDFASARQVWSRDEGYPGDPHYRDFYRDIGFDLDLDYLQPFLAAAGRRSFTGIKYFAITGKGAAKVVYSREAALGRVDTHAAHFLAARAEQLQRAAELLQRPPIVVAPYDAELFGHWWFEGPEFLDRLVRRLAAGQQGVALVTPSEYLQRHASQQLAAPAASSWGQGGYWRQWLEEANQWLYPHLLVAQERMTELANRAPAAELETRALRQAGRELLLAQASDWPFILHTGTSPDYARQRLESHLLRFTKLYEQLVRGEIDLEWLSQIEARDNLFTDLDYTYWKGSESGNQP